MRNVFNHLVLVLAAALVLPQAQAQSSASISMDGSGHVAAIDQQGDNAAVSAVIVQHGAGNIAGSSAPDGPYPLARPHGIWQLDSSATQAVIEQHGEGGRAILWQKYAQGASAALTQDSATRGALLALTQENVSRAQAILLQSGGPQQALGLQQGGSELDASVRQSGDSLGANLKQYGSGLRLAVLQQGASGSLQLTQIGSLLSADVSMDSGAGHAELFLLQGDSGAYAQASQQQCAGCRMSLRQGGSAPSAWLLQSGGAHWLDATQSGAHQLRVTPR